MLGQVSKMNPIDDAWSIIKMNDPHEDDYTIEDDPFQHTNQTFDNRYINQLRLQMLDDGENHLDIRNEMSSGEKGADTRKRNIMLNQNRLAELEEINRERFRRGRTQPISFSTEEPDMKEKRFHRRFNQALMYRSEPMDIAFQLLKERVSPEAKRRKLEYDKKYESSPERVKYREDLNRERRRRGIYGSHDHKDVSHTKGGKLTLEGEHENRARHFKEKGTLRDLKMGGLVGHLVGAARK